MAIQQDALHCGDIEVAGEGSGSIRCLQHAIDQRWIRRGDSFQGKGIYSWNLRQYIAAPVGYEIFHIPRRHGCWQDEGTQNIIDHRIKPGPGENSVAQPDIFPVIEMQELRLVKEPGQTRDSQVAEDGS